MKTWHLLCVDRASRKETIEPILADDEREAFQIAASRGLIVGKVLKVGAQSELVPQRAIFSVQTIDRQSGRDNWVRVEASSREEAQRRVAALGEVVGECRLVEVVASNEPARLDPVEVANRALTAIPGVVTCPKCDARNWEGGRGCATWVLVVLLFPIGLLLLFLKPTWRCVNCGYSYSSYSSPTRLNGQ